MPIDQTELLTIVQQLAEDQNLHVTIKESMKGACVAGGGALFGGIFGGPLGLGIGGILGSLYAAWNGSGKYKSVVLVISEDMTDRQKAQLADSLQKAFEGIQIEDVIMLTSVVMGSKSIQTLLITELCKFLQNEMGLAIASQ